MKISRLLVSSALPAITLASAAPAIAGEVTGTVTDASETVALQAAEIRIIELNRTAVTERDGSFRFVDVPAGKYTLETRYVGVPTQRQTISVSETGTLRTNVTLGTADARNILVFGQGANQASALSRKRAADTVSDVLTRDAIGQFPDQNVAESLRRLPGINILDDQGEGRFVSVRGLDPQLNATSLNGVRLPAPESDVRSVALDVISSDIIESIEVKKSLTPDMDADTLGASIEIETTSAFDRKKHLLTAKIEGSYNDFSGDITPKASLDFAGRLNDNVGISGEVSYYKRKFETDNIEADDWNEEDGNIFAEEVQYRDYDVERERISATLGLDFKVGDTTELYVKGLYSQFDDQEFRRGVVFEFDEAPISGSGTSVLFSDATSDPDEAPFTIERHIKDRFETQKIRSAVFGGKTNFDAWHFEYSASWAKSTENENGSIDPAKFSREFAGDGVDILFDYGNPRIPLHTVSGNTFAFSNASGYELDDIELTDISASEDEEYAVKFDAGHDFFMTSGTFTVQAGFKGRWREKQYNKEVAFYENDSLTLDDVRGVPTYRIIDLSPVPSYRGARTIFEANRGDFELVPADSQFDSAVEDYRIKEDILAGYLLGRFESPTLQIIGGVRYEHTSNDIFGNAVTFLEENGTTVDEDTILVEPVMFEKDYGDWLPSLNIRWEPRQNLILRAAGYRSLVRPTPAQIAPRFSVEESDDGEREGEFGNPALKPYEAWNFDASVEYYMSGNGAISAAFFYKDIKNYIVDTMREDASFNGIDFNEATIPINGPSAEVWGVELGFSQAFTMLPAPFDGLIVQANYTYTDASGLVPTDGDVTDLRKITLPATSKHTVNGVLGYEKGPWSIRIAGTYRDKYLDELGSSAELDRIVDNHFQVDLSAKYQLTDLIQLYYEWVNINDAKYFAYNNFGGRRNLYQYERYNWTMKFGARLTF